MKEYLNILKQVQLFQGINEKDLLSILNCLRASMSEFSKNEFIFTDGDDVTNIGIVLSGRIQIIKEDYQGNRNILTEIDQAGIFAVAFLCAKLNEIPVSVLTVTDSIILFINYKKILNVCSSVCSFHLKLIENMLQIIAKKNMILNQKIEFLSKRTTREKLLAYLYEEKKLNGSSKFSINFKRQELADFLCIDRSAMTKELIKMRNDGIINFNKNQFELI